MATSKNYNSSDGIIVSIKCLAYNHEPYIRQCLEGFVMQQTNFRFEAVVHDDASTDGTADIIREYAEKYPDIIIPIYETENRYSKHDGSLSRIIDAQIRGKYIALCEGDDYWTDPMKLQKQVDFLESHPDFSLCCHKISLYFENEGTVVAKNYDAYENSEADFTFSNYENLRHWITETSSLVFRNGIIDQNINRQYNYYRDVHQAYHLLKIGKGRFMSFYGSVYRKQDGGIYSSLSQLEKYNISYEIFKEIKSHNLDDKEIVGYFADHKNIYFRILRSSISREKHSPILRKMILQFLNDIIREDGLKAGVISTCKFIKSFLRI